MESLKINPPIKAIPEKQIVEIKLRKDVYDKDAILDNLKELDPDFMSIVDADEKYYYIYLKSNIPDELTKEDLEDVAWVFVTALLSDLRKR